MFQDGRNIRKVSLRRTQEAEMFVLNEIAGFVLGKNVFFCRYAARDWAAKFAQQRLNFRRLPQGHRALRPTTRMVEGGRGVWATWLGVRPASTFSHFTSASAYLQ